MRFLSSIGDCGSLWIPQSAALKYYNSGIPLFHLKPWILLDKVPSDVPAPDTWTEPDFPPEKWWWHVRNDPFSCSLWLRNCEWQKTYLENSQKKCHFKLAHSWQIVSKKGVLEDTKTYPVIRNNSPAYRLPVKKAWISLPYTLAPRF